MAWVWLWDGRSAAVNGGLELSYLGIEAFAGGIVAQDFTGHIVDGGGNLVTLFLCDMAQRFALWEVTADYTVITFVTSTLTAGNDRQKAYYESLADEGERFSYQKRVEAQRQLDEQGYSSSETEWTTSADSWAQVTVGG